MTTADVEKLEKLQENNVYLKVLILHETKQLEKVNENWNGTDILEVFDPQLKKEELCIENLFEVTEDNVKSAKAEILLNKFLRILMRVEDKPIEDNFIIDLSNTSFLGNGYKTLISDIEAGIKGYQDQITANNAEIKTILNK